MGGFSQIDRSSGLVVAAVAILTLSGSLAVILSRANAVAADASTPRGVVATYVRAIQAGDADRAWELLSQNATGPAPAGAHQPNRTISCPRMNSANRSGEIAGRRLPGCGSSR